MRPVSEAASSSTIRSSARKNLPVIASRPSTSSQRACVRRSDSLALATSASVQSVSASLWTTRSRRQTSDTTRTRRPAERQQRSARSADASRIATTSHRSCDAVLVRALAMQPSVSRNWQFASNSRASPRNAPSPVAMRAQRTSAGRPREGSPPRRPICSGRRRSTLGRRRWVCS